MEYGGRQQYQAQTQSQATQNQDPHSYYYTHNPERPQPPPAPPPPQQAGSGHGNGHHGHSHGYPPIYKSSATASASDRPSPPPTPLSANQHMSNNMPPNVGRSMSDHMGMYHHPPSRSDEASGSRRTTSPTDGGSVHNSGGNRPASIKRVGGKANVSSACAPCKKAHLACDIMRPCKRCINMGKEDLCEDVPVRWASIPLGIGDCEN